MYSFYFPIMTSFLQVARFFSTMDSGYLDILKILAGSIGWVGGLTMIMYFREKRKNPSFHLIEKNKS